jgi:AraC-like DNA-binding protein
MKNFMSFDFQVQTITLVDFVPPGSGASLHRPRASHGLVLHLDGSRQYLFADGREISVSTQEVIFLPKGSNYHVKCDNDNNCYFINFQLFVPIDCPPFKLKVQDLQKILPAFKEARQAWSAKQPGYMMKCKEKLYRILYQLQKECHTEQALNQKAERIAPAVQYILGNYSSKLLRVDELADMCGITPEYFRAIFHKCYGTSPVKYINHLRIERAKELILSDSYTIADAAELSGFSDISYFSKAFKKATGVSPSEYGEQTLSE